MSGRFTPAAATLIRTSSGPGRGTGRSTSASSSAPSGCGATMAFMDDGADWGTALRLIDTAAPWVNDSPDGPRRTFPEQAGRPAGCAGQAGPRPDLDRGTPGAHRGAEGRDRARRSPHRQGPGAPLGGGRAVQEELAAGVRTAADAINWGKAGHLPLIADAERMTLV